jgi:SAM-dependent methyltransferase
MEATEIPNAIPFELQSLANAHRYQRWLKNAVEPFLGNRILELGSGIGNLSQHLPVRERLVLSDIEENFVNLLQAKFGGKENVSVLRLPSLRDPALAGENLDTIVSFNVLEHVENDAALLEESIALLQASRAPGPKRIVSLVPAHQWAFGAIDESFGHFRRYSDASFRETLRRAGAQELGRGRYYSRYMNLPALLGWWLNGRVLGKSSIGTGNMEAFERLCPVIRPVDDFLHRVLRLPWGNSLLAVYRVDHG